MTGQGEATRQQAGVTVTAEIRAINSRYLKIAVRSSEGYSSLDPRIEAQVRQRIRRGTLSVNVRIHRAASADDYRVNEVVLLSYLDQLRELAQRSGDPAPVHLDRLLELPGVVEEVATLDVNADAYWELTAATLDDALAQVDQMRLREGQAMARELHRNCQEIAVEVQAIAARAPHVVAAYQQRLTDRLNKLLQQHSVTVDAADIVREVGTFADRSDVSEELVRLQSHLDQFARVMDDEQSNGKKLDFLTQEMFREINTIGSKANDAAIAHHVVQVKTTVERMREMIQNIE